jgi:fructokinase
VNSPSIATDVQPAIVGLGEILWDLLPSGKQLGGAPANFAYCSHLLGSRSVVASRIGSDPLGSELRNVLRQRGLTDRFLQSDPVLSTGTVHVQLHHGHPKFEITNPSAWDALEFTPQWKALAESAQAVCFGSLAQRAPGSRETILRFLDSVPSSTAVIFDLNLRQSFYSKQIIADSMRPGAIVKLSDEELPQVAALLDLPAQHEEFCRRSIERFHLRMVCITRGANGSILFGPSGVDEHGGFKVQLQDAVGAGDAFTAGLVHEFLRGSSLAAMNDTANRMGAWIASQSGAMPEPPPQCLASALAALQPR